jgi:hypothetical protein
MDEQNNNGQTGGGQGNPSQTQPAPTLGQHAQGQQQPLGQRPQDGQAQRQQPAGQHQEGRQPAGQSQEHPDGIIPKAAEMAEKAVETGLEKTSGGVGSTIDKVADAAISALGGRPKENSDLQSREGATDEKPSY